MNSKKRKTREYLLYPPPIPFASFVLFHPQDGTAICDLPFRSYYPICIWFEEKEMDSGGKKGKIWKTKFEGKKWNFQLVSFPTTPDPGKENIMRCLPSCLLEIFLFEFPLLCYCLLYVIEWSHGFFFFQFL